MTKSSRFIKRRLALVLMLLLSIESFAAVVGDNDGAAFITKAEFDSMKNDFQSQLDRYNSSLDNKIDGAIASYLSGVHVARQQSLGILVTNYDEMMWVNTLKLYGKYRRWTNDIYNYNYQSASNEWFKPNLGERRFLLRSGQGFYLIDQFLQLDGHMICCFDIVFKKIAGGGATQKSTTTDDSTNNGAPIAFLRLDKDSAGYYKLSTSYPIVNYFDSMNFQWFDYHNDSTRFGNGLWAWKWSPYTIQNLEFLTPVQNQVFAYKTTFKSASSGPFWEVVRPTFANFGFPYVYEEESAFSTRGYEKENRAAIHGDASLIDLNEYLAEGITWHYFDPNNSAKQKQLLTHMMFGKDNNDLVNLGYRLTTVGAMPKYDFSSSDESFTVIASCSSVTLSNPLSPGDAAVTQKSFSPGLNLTLNLPKFPVGKFSAINTNYFEYKDRPLRIGEGLPIIANVTNKGIMHLSCDYEVKHLTTSNTDNKIYVDVADSDFLQTNVKYVNGYIGNVDINNTSSAATAIHNISITNSNKKLELTIPVEAEQDLWLRVAPQNDTGGYYVQLKNLKIIQVIE